MDKQIFISNELYEDEVVCFIADRHHTTPHMLLQYFLSQEEGVVTDTEEALRALRLEENEIEILRKLTSIND